MISNFNDLKDLILSDNLNDKQVAEIVRKSIRIFIFTPIKSRKKLCEDLLEVHITFEGKTEKPLFTFADNDIMKFD